MLLLADADVPALEALLSRFGLDLIQHGAGSDIPGSYWGDSEAGLTGHRIHVRPDTPIHSVLHEGCHFICMDSSRRESLHQDAGGDYDEENAVCYLQILLANHLPGFSCEAMMSDMDAWGYTFRLGSSRNWFERDAADARHWLIAEGIIDAAGSPTWNVRGGANPR